MPTKTAELTGADLDFWVMRAEGFEPAEVPRGNNVGWMCDGPALQRDGKLVCWGCTPKLFSSDWEQGGPIIERERIEIGFLGSGHGWQAAANPMAQADLSLSWVDGPTPLIAAMRCYVASKFGEEV